MAERWPGLLNTTEAAEYLGVSPDTVQRERALGRLKSVLLRGMVKYSRETLDAYIRDLPEGAGACAANAARDRKQKEQRNSKRQARMEQPAT